MKLLIVISILSLCCLTTKAQLGQSTSQIKQIMSNEIGWRFFYYGKASDGVMDGAFCLRYSEDKQFLGKSFYFVNDSCKMIKLSYLKKQRMDVIKDMNNTYISKGNNIWINEKGHSKFELLPDEKGLVLFNVLETPYSGSN